MKAWWSGGREGGRAESSERRACESCGCYLGGGRSGTAAALNERGVGNVGVWVRGLMEAGLSVRG